MAEQVVRGRPPTRSGLREVLLGVAGDTSHADHVDGGTDTGADNRDELAQVYDARRPGLRDQPETDLFVDLDQDLAGPLPEHDERRLGPELDPGFPGHRHSTGPEEG